MQLITPAAMMQLWLSAAAGRVACQCFKLVRWVGSLLTCVRTNLSALAGLLHLYGPMHAEYALPEVLDALAGIGAHKRSGSSY